MTSLSLARNWGPALLLALGVLLGACGQGEAGERTSAAALDSVRGAAPLDAEVAGEVELWHFWGSPDRRGPLREVIGACEEALPQITVKDVFKPWGDIWTANVTAVAAGSGMPDVIVEDRPRLPQRAADNVVQNLQPFADRDGLDPGHFWDFTWAETLYEGDSYGVPFETDVRLLYWNKNAFREAGLDPEQPPATWDELWAYADRLDKQDPDGSFERIGFFPAWGAGPNIWALTNGYDWVQDGRPAVDGPRFVETMEWVKAWADRYGGYRPVQRFWAGFGAPPNDAFMSGAVPMIVDLGSYDAVLDFYQPRAESGEPLEWGMAHLPYNREKATWSAGFALSIPKGAPNPEGAWELIKCMTGPEAQRFWAEETASTPANVQAARDSLLMRDPAWRTIVEQMDWSRGVTFVSAYPNFEEQVDRRQEAVWSGEAEAEAAMAEAQAAINRAMAGNSDE